MTRQIQSTLTAEQIHAIADMKITQVSAQTIMQELDLEITARQQGMGGGTPGMPPSGGQPPSGDQAIGTPPADGGPMRSGSFIQPQLLEALIQFLETKSAS